MSSNEHATYFGCSATTKGIRTQDEGRTSKTLPSGLSGGHTESHARSPSQLSSPILLETNKDPFRASLVSKMDTLVWDFRNEKTLWMETMYQILQVLHEANIDKPVREKTFESMDHMLTSLPQSKREQSIMEDKPRERRVGSQSCPTPPWTWHEHSIKQRRCQMTFMQTQKGSAPQMMTSKFVQIFKCRGCFRH